MNKIARRLLFTAALAMIVVPGVWLGTTFWQYYQADKEYTALESEYTAVETQVSQSAASGSGQTDTFTLRSIDWAALREQNPEIVGWVEVDAIESLSYPIVQHEDDSYYLDHSYLGAQNTSGAIFMEAANNGDFSDAHTIVYGHNMKSGKMFGSLKKFADEAFYRQHGGGITLYTPDGVYRYRIFSAEYVGDTDPNVYTIGYAHDESYLAFIQKMAERSLYDTGTTLSADSQVMTLSTCSYNEATRFVVHAVLEYKVETK